MKDLSFEELHEGREARGDYRISRDVYEGFMGAFVDRNPLHTDEAYAVSKGFPGRVMHGAILNGFISHFVGMELPGMRSLIHSVKIDFKRPSFLGDIIVVRGVVEQKIEAVRCVVLKLILENVTRDEIVAQARVQVGLL